MMCCVSGANRRDGLLTCGTELHSHESAEAQILTLEQSQVKRSERAESNFETGTYELVIRSGLHDMSIWGMGQ